MSGRSPKLTVFHLDDEGGLRGGERQLLYLAVALRATGHENVICCRGGSLLAHEASAQGFEVLPLPFRHEFDVASAWRLARAAQRRADAIVHAHTGHTVSIAALSALFGGPPAVAHRRGAAPLRSALSRWLKYGRMQRVVAISRATASLLERGGLPSHRVVVIPDCIPVSADEWRIAGFAAPRFTPRTADEKRAAREAIGASYGLDANAVWIGNLAALVPLKDHATLIAASHELISRRPNTVVVIGGDGPERERLAAEIARRGLTGRVALIGQCDAARLLAASDIFALTSRVEGMGSALLEAAACGLPAVATAVGGVPEVLTDGETGLLVPLGDAIALTNALARLIDEPALAARLGRGALAGVQRFGLTVSAQRMEAVYHELLGTATR